MLALQEIKDRLAAVLLGFAVAQAELKEPRIDICKLQEATKVRLREVH